MRHKARKETSVTTDLRQSQLRRAENERVFKDHNARIEQYASQLLDDESRRKFPLGFICECSDENCHEKLEISLSDFRKLRANPRQFILLAGHEQGDIERVARQVHSLEVVEKFETPPPTNGRLNAT